MLGWLVPLLVGGYALTSRRASPAPPPLQGQQGPAMAAPAPSVAPVDGIALAASWPAFGYPGHHAVASGDAKIGGLTLDEAALRAWQAGQCPVTWVPVRCTGPGEPSLVVLVSEDAFALGNVRRARLPVSRVGAGVICRNLDAVLPTPRILDAIYGAAAVRLTPRLWSGGAGPPAWDKTSPSIVRPPAGSTLLNNPGIGRDVWLNQQLTLEAQRGGARGLIANAGKSICTSSKLVTAEKGAKGTLLAIYGWYQDTIMPASPPTNLGPWAPMDPTLARPAKSVIQPGNAPHNALFVDYSSILTLVYRWAKLDGQSVDLVSLYGDPKQNSLVHTWGGAWGNPVPLPTY